MSAYWMGHTYGDKNFQLSPALVSLCGTATVSANKNYPRFLLYLIPPLLCFLPTPVFVLQKPAEANRDQSAHSIMVVVQAKQPKQDCTALDLMNHVSGLCPSPSIYTRAHSEARFPCKNVFIILACEDRDLIDRNFRARILAKWDCLSDDHVMQQDR